MTESEKIETLREERNRVRAEESRLYRLGYAMDAQIADLRGCPEEAAWYRALADEKVTQAERHRLYVRLQASRCMDGNYDGIPAAEVAEVRAEVERLRGVIEDTKAPAHANGGSSLP